MKLIKLFLLMNLCLASGLLKANTAVQAYEDENYPLAKELFEKDKNSAISKLYLGRLELKNGHLDEAEELIKAALEMRPNDSNYHYWFASISGIQAGNASIFSAPGYAADSKEHFIKAVELDPQNTQALSGLISFYIQAPSIVGGSIKEARKLIIKLTELNKKEGLSAQISLHRSENETDKELEKAEELASTFPKYPEALLKAGFSYQGAKRFKKAYKYFNRASSIKENELNVSLSKKEKRSEKIAIMNAVYQIGRNAVLGDIKIDEGIAALKSYLKLTPNKNQASHNWAKLRMAALYLKKGNKTKAKELALAAKKDKDNNGPRKEAKKLLKQIKRK